MTALSLPIIVIAFVPGLAWLAYIRYHDRYAPEPRHLVAFVFFLGMASTLPASTGNYLAEKLLSSNFLDLVKLLGLENASRQVLELFFHFCLFFLVVGPVEELSKFLVVRLSIYYHPEFDEPIDALVYCAAAALGFASLENVIYALREGQEVLYLRALLSVPGHLLFSAIWGFGLARARFAGKSVLPGLFISAFLHGLYDFVLVAFGQLGYSQLGLVLVLPLMGAMAWMLQRRIAALQRTSGPHMERRRNTQGLLPVTLSTLPPLPRPRPIQKVVASPSAPVSAAVPAAKQARPQVSGDAAWGWCGRCKTAVRATDRFCGRCGRPLALAPRAR